MPDTATMGGVADAAPNPPETQPNEESTPTTMPGTGETVPDMVEQTAKEVGIPISILRAEAQQESQFRQQARSQKGAVGVMQLMPKTAKALGVNPENPEENIRGGATYLKQLHDQFGDWEHALAAYDWGPRHVRNAVREYGDDWLSHAPQETRNYVNTILSSDTMSGEGEHPMHGAGGSWEPETTTEKIEREAKTVAGKIKQAAETPLIMETPPELELPAKAAKFAAEYLERNGHTEAANALHGYAGVMEGETDLIKGMSTPENLAMMFSLGRLKEAGAAGKVLDRLISSGFSVSQLWSAYKNAPEVKKAIDSGDYEAAGRALTSEVGNVIMGGMAAHGAVEGLGKVKPTETKSQPEALITIPGAVPIKDATRPLPENEYLYHATDKSRAASIEKNGLRANTWFAKTPQDALRSGAVPISGNRGDLRVYAVPKAEVTPAVPDQADIGAREVEKGRFVQSTAPHVPSYEVTGNGHIVRSLRPEPTEALPAQMTPEEAVNAAGGIFRGMNSAGLVEIALPREMTDRIPGLNDRMKDYVSVTLPREQVTPENVKAAMDKKLADYGVTDQRFVHYSQTPVEGGTLEGGRRGEAQAGSEQARLQHENAVPGVYAYREGTQPESQIGSRLHKSTFTNNGKIADISGAQKDSFEYVYQQAMNRYKEAGDNDTIASQKALNDAEASLQAAGFAGYEHKAGRAGTVFLFGDQPIEQKAPPLVLSILEAHEANGGSTFNPTKGNLAGTENYAVAMYPQRGEVISGKLTPDAMQKFIDKNADLLKDPNNSIGTWTNEGKQYLDIVHTIPDREEAIRLGRENNQKAIFDLKNMQEIPTGGTGEIPVSAPEIHTDLHDSIKNQFEKQMDEKSGAISDHKESGDFGFLWRDGTSGYIGNYGDAEGAHDDMMQTMQESLQRNVGGTDNMFRDAGVANWHLGGNGDLTVSVPTGATLSSDQIAAITSEARKLGSSQVIVATGDEAPSDYVNGKIVPNPKYKEVDIKNPTPAALSKRLQDTFGENITPISAPEINTAADVSETPLAGKTEVTPEGEKARDYILPRDPLVESIMKRHGLTEAQAHQFIRHHEAGHAYIAVKRGFAVGDMESSDVKRGSAGAQNIIWNQGTNPLKSAKDLGNGTWAMDPDEVIERWPDIAAVMLGGGGANEALDNVPMDVTFLPSTPGTLSYQMKNPGMSSDMTQFFNTTKSGHLTAEETIQAFQRIAAEIRKDLTPEAVRAKLREHTETRQDIEPNLQMRAESVQRMVQDAQEAENEEANRGTTGNASERIEGAERAYPERTTSGEGTPAEEIAGGIIEKPRLASPRAEIKKRKLDASSALEDPAYKGFIDLDGSLQGYGQEHEDTIEQEGLVPESEMSWDEEENDEKLQYAVDNLVKQGVIRVAGYGKPESPLYVQISKSPTESQRATISKTIRNQGGVVFDVAPEGLLGKNQKSRISGEGYLPSDLWRAVDKVFGNSQTTVKAPEINAEDEETAFPFGANAPEELGPHTISTRFPSAVKATENPVENHELKVDAEALANTPGLTEKLADKVKDYLGLKIPKNAKPETAVKMFIRHVADNIKYIYDKTTPAEREMSAQWYPVGAHKMTQDMADNNGISHRQAAGVVAALSPQKDWDINVSLARRAIEIYKNQKDTVTTPEMLDTLRTIASIPENNSLLRFRSLLEGKTFGELSGDEQALWLRLYDEAHNSRNYEAWNPDGTSKGIATKANGEPGKAAWGNLNEIGKALKILDDGSRENISHVLGKGHKVRSFYNNIIEPNSDRHDITVDTHAVAAGLLRPLGTYDKEVEQNFGKAGTSSITGVQGTYPLFADAYRLAAKELDIQHPNQLQSIVWEHIRNLFNREFKTPENKAVIDAIWKEYKDGKIGAKTARNKIYDYAERHRAESIGEGRTAENEGELSEGGVPRTGTRPATSGIGGRTASLLAGGTKGKTGTFLDFLPKPKFAKPYAGTK